MGVFQPGDKIRVQGIRLAHLVDGQGIPQPQLPHDFHRVGQGHTGCHDGLGTGNVGVELDRGGGLIGRDLGQLVFQRPMQMVPELGRGRPAGRIALEQGLTPEGC